MVSQPRRGRRRLDDGIKIDFLIMADSAQESQGKLYLLGGGWTLHNAQGYPSPLAFGLALGILVPWSETNRVHEFQFVIRQSEGQEIARGGGNFEAGRPTGIPAAMTQRVVVALSGQLPLPTSGTYEVIATVPGDERRITFEALPPKP